MKSKLARALYWLVFNSGLVGLLYLAAVDHVAGAQNVLVFVAWFLLILVAPATSDEAAKRYAAANIPKHPIPLRIRVTFSVAFLCALIWCGWWVTGIAWLAQILCISVVRAKAAKLAEAQP